MKKLLRPVIDTIKNPEPFFTAGAKVVTHIVYNLKIVDFHHVPEEGPAILIANHVSYMDGMIINACCKRRVRFIIDEDIYKVPPVKYFMDFNRAIPILPTRESVAKALETISEGLKDGDLICIFPEGQLTYTGNMGRFRFGIEWMLKEDPVPVVPIALKGLWGSILSRKYRRSKFRWFPRSFRRKITAKCGPAIPPEIAKVSNLQRTVMELKDSI